MTDESSNEDRERTNGSLARGDGIRLAPGENNSSILWLHEQAPIPSGVFGGKASGLRSFQDSTKSIPKGFALSSTLVWRVAHGRTRKNEMVELESAFNELVRHSPSGKLIVRSSSCLEDNIYCQLPGVFQSIDNVQTFGALLAGIVKCFASGNSPVAVQHLQRRGINTISGHMGVLIQEQIDSSYSAVLKIGPKSCLVELYRGALRRPIAGLEQPTVMHVQLGNSKPSFQTIRNQQHVTKTSISRIQKSILSLIHICRHSLQSGSIVLEIGFTGERYHIFQIRNTQRVLDEDREMLQVNGKKNVLLAEQDRIGFKAAAMKFFTERGLFTLPSLVLEPNMSNEQVREQIEAAQFVNGPFTVRFSYRRNFGLPRKFVEDKSKISEVIFRHRRQDWTTIVHPYIRVERSFELLLGRESALVEQIPGMWESENRQSPDVFLIQGRTVRAWRWTKSRWAKFSDPFGCRRAEVRPTSRQQISQWSETVSSFTDRLRQDFEPSLPLNFHFVEGGDGNWHFLNIRKGFDFENAEEKFQSLHVVERPSDLKQWDQRSPIVLRISTGRGAERELIPLVEKLRVIDVPIYIDFGILSHPAMILREYGINVRPSYFARHRVPFDNNAYDGFEITLDKGDDAIRRIMAETAIYSNSKFRVVTDRDPIVANHLLVVAHDKIRGFSDLDDLKSLEALLTNKELREAVGSKSWIFVERGRARFCTSGFSDRRAHGHLLAAHMFDRRVIEDFASVTHAKFFESIGAALSAASKIRGEYLLFSKDGSGAYLSADCIAREKRFVRSFLKKRLRGGYA